MQVWSDELTILFLGTFYSIGLLIYTLIATIAVNASQEDGKQTKFLTTLTFSFLGGIVGALISVAIYQIFVPKDIIYGTANYQHELEEEWQLLKICIIIPIGTTLLFSYISLKRQTKQRAV
jgi:hypothetical protein